MKIMYDYQILRAQKFGGISRYFYEIITIPVVINSFSNAFTFLFSLSHLCFPIVRFVSKV